MYNHLDLFVSINRAPGGTERIVEFDILPKSVDWKTPCHQETGLTELEIVSGSE